MGKTTEKINDTMKEILISLYNQGKMDSEIAKELKVTVSAIHYWRKKLNLKSKFTYNKISKIDINKFEKLFSLGLSDYKIAKELNMSPDGIYSFRQRHGYIREDIRQNKPIALTEYQKQVLLGTMLGDSSFKKSKDCINPAVTCSHCLEQEEYCKHKTEIFKSLGASYKYRKRNLPDKRNGKIYECYNMFIPANPKLKYWYNSFYKEKKVIPFNLFKYFTEVSLAFLFMDDGSKTKNGYTIATNCFTTEDLDKFRIFLKQKFNIETSIFKSKVLYILSKSKNTFTDLIKPYIIPCMQYKLHKLSF